MNYNLKSSYKILIINNNYQKKIEDLGNKNELKVSELKCKYIDERAILNEKLFNYSEKISIINLTPEINESVLFKKVPSKNYRDFVYMALTLPTKNELKIFYFAKIDNKIIFKE